MSADFGRNEMAFTVPCRCGKRRGFLPHAQYDGDRDMRAVLAAGQVPRWAGVLICPTCDYDHDGASVIPREYAVRDVSPRP